MNNKDLREKVLRKLVSDKVKEYRSKYKITQIELSVIIGVTRSYVSSIENISEKISIETIKTSIKEIDDSFLLDDDLIDEYDRLLDRYYYSLAALDNSKNIWNKITQNQNALVNSVLHYRYKLFDIVHENSSFKTISKEKIEHLIKNEKYLCDSDRQILYNYYGLLCVKRSDYNMAENIYSKALKLSDNPLTHSAVLHNYVKVLSEKGRTLEAYDALKRIIEEYRSIGLDKRVESCRLLLANIYANDNNYDRAIAIYDDIIKANNTQNINIALSNLLHCYIKKGDIKKAIECLNENEDRDITIFTEIFFKQALYIAYHINDHNLFIKWYTKYRSSHLYNAGSFNTSIISLFKDFMDGMSKSEIVAKAEKILNRLEKNIDNTDDMTYILEILYHLAKDDGNNDKALSVLNELYNINKMSFLS